MFFRFQHFVQLLDYRQKLIMILLNRCPFAEFFPMFFYLVLQSSLLILGNLLSDNIVVLAIGTRRDGILRLRI
jgi:hypothetical protein